MAWQYVEYTYPIEVWLEKMILWLDSVSRLYFAIKARDEDDWTFFSGNAAHGLATGELLVSRGTVEADAQTNYWRPTPDADNRVLGVFPGIQNAKYARVYVDDANDNPTQIYEFRPSTYFAADEIITGHLRVTDQFASPPLITVTKSSIDRIKIGNFTGTTFGLIGYDASSNVIFELSDAQLLIGGFTLSASALLAGTTTTRIQLDTSSGIHLGATAFADAPFRVALNGDLIATSATISGAISAATIDIGGADTTSFHVDINGNLWSGAAIADKATAPFRVSNAGALVATSATITGVITANTGKIGGANGWVISAGYLKDVAGVVGLSSVVSGGDDIRFWAGHATPESAPFYVTEAGVIKASSGTIGGWTLGATTLSSASIVIDDGNDRIRSTNYVSGINGAGFTLEPDLLEVGNIAARGIFRTAVFQKDVVNVCGGSLAILDGDCLAEDMTAGD